MKKMIILACLLMTASLFAESFRCTAKLKGFQNKIVCYVESDLNKDFKKLLNYANYAMTLDIAGCMFTETDWFEDLVENSSEHSWYRYFDAAWEKYSYAKRAFEIEYSKNDKKKLDKIGSGSNSLVYQKLVFNAGEITINGKPNAKCMQWEFFCHIDENNVKHVLHVWQGSKNNDPKDFVTYLD